MTQNEWVLEALKRGPVTPIDALQGCGCFRLGARVWELRQQGHDIRTEHFTDPNGKVYAKYHLQQPMKEAA